MAGTIGVMVRAFLALALALFSGCAYLEDRGNDFADCFRGSVGIGLGAQAHAQVGPFIAGAGVWNGSCAGHLGRHGGVLYEGTYLGVPLTNIAFPILIAVTPSYITKASSAEKTSFVILAPLGLLGTSAVFRKLEGEGEDRQEFSLSLCALDVGAFLQAEPDRLEDWRDLFWITVSAHAFVGFEVGFNLAEFADFLMGWFGIDLCGDDGRGKGEEEERLP